MREEKITVRPYPIGDRHERRMLCPECENSLLPIDAVTECDNCGTHLEIYAKIYSRIHS